MLVFTSQSFGAILAGIYLFSLYFQTKFKSFISLSFLCFLFAGLKIFFPDNFRIQILISAIPIIVVLIFSIREAKKLEEQGKGIEILQPTRKSIIFGLILMGIYILSRILYFDRQ